jgi:predicted enzyme related to lactoylglutathione lyase
VFGWQFTAGRGQDGWNIPDTVPMAGVAGGRSRARIVPMYRVDDITSAVQRVRAAGGTATEPAHEGYGIRAECTDDQGTTFYLGQL